MNIIKNKVDELLKTYGSHYFKNFDTKKVTNALFAGNAVLRNLELKTEAIDMKTSPLKLVSAKFEELQLVIPWWNLLSEPVIIRASGLHISLETKSLQDVNLNRDDEIKAMIALIINYAKTEYQKELGQRSGVLDFWMVKNIVDRVIDNAQIHLHGIQLEIKHAMQTNPFSVEVSLKNLEMYTTDSTFMNKQFTKTSLGWDNSTTKQIFKLLNLDHFVVSIRPLETSAISAKLKSRAYENSMENSIFRLSVQVRLIKNSNHGDQEPDYEATVKMHHNDLNLTQWQIQRVLNLLDFLKRLSDRLEDQRGKIRYRPTKRIADFPSKPLRKDEAGKEDPTLALQRSNTVREWWEYAVLKVINKEKKSSKHMNKDQGKFYGLVKAMKIDQILNYEVPGTTMALYEEHFLEDLRKLAKSDFDITKMVHDDSRRHTFESMVMLIPHHVQKVLAKRFARELAKEVKDRERNNWKNYAMSFIPYLGDSGLSEDQKQVQEMLKGEFKNDKQSFSKYICKVNIEIKKGNYTLVSDLVDGQKGIFGFYLDGFSIDVKAFQDKIEASIDLKNFELKLTKLAGQAVVSEFPVIKSTVEKGKSFFSVKLLNQTIKTKKSTSLEVYVQHVDLIFVNQIVSELIAFFKMQKYESESASGIASSMGKDFGGATNATKVMANANSSDISILVNVLSPRVLVPMEKKVNQITDETNLFVLYLGDMEFKHSIKSGTISALGSKLNLRLNHFKLEYWEDYKQGLQQLGVLQVDEYADNLRTEPVYVRNFVLLDLVANIRLLGANDGRSRSISVLLDYTDFHINPNVFHQMLKIQQIVDLKEELSSTTEQLLEERYKIADNTVTEERLAFKKTMNDRYEYKHLVFTKDTMYVFPDEEEIEPEETYSLSGYNLSVAEEKKTGGYILHLWKDEQVLSIALKDFKQAKHWVNLLLQDLVGISPRDLSDKKKIEKSKINLEVTIKKCELALYNELFEPTTAFAIHYLEFRFSNDPHMKVKLSMDDMRIENFQDNFRSRGLQTILWIGPTPAPRVTDWRKPRPLTTKETKEVDESHYGTRNDASVMSKSYTTRGASILPARYDQLKTNNLSTIFNQSVVDRQPVADSFMLNATRARAGETLGLNQTKNETLLLGEPEVGFTQEIGDFMRDNRSELGRMSKMSVEHVDLRSYEHAVERSTQGTNPHLKEGFILYLEKPENLMEVDLHIVNFTATWDTEYVVNFQKKLNDYLVVPTSKATEDVAPKKYRVKKGDPSTPDVVTMKAKIKFDRLCTILRSNNMNLFDMVFVDMKLLYTQMTKRMLVNIYSKRFAVRDLTAYPFTKKPEDLKQYSAQKKNLLFSFVEGSTATQPKQSADDLDNHGIIVLAEVIGEPWLDDSRIGTKAEVIANNGEINFFLQPTFRLLDILLYQMLGFITPDDIKKITVEEMVRRSTNPKRLSHNVFLKNLTVNMLPNFDVEKSLVMHMPSVMIANEQYVDKTRTLVPSLAQQVNSENMNIDVRGAVIRGFRKGVEAIVMPQMAISFDKLLYFGYLEKILGPEQGKFQFN